MTENDLEIEMKLLPILREGVEMVKIILFMKLKESLSEREPNWSSAYRNKIIGAVLNDIFGVANLAPVFVEFSMANTDAIQSVIGELPTILEELLLPLTDALRIMVLCDHQEGADNSVVLQQAQEKGFLEIDRDLPMPNTFIDLVRRLGCAYGLLSPPTASTDSPDSASKSND